MTCTKCGSSPTPGKCVKNCGPKAGTCDFCNTGCGSCGNCNGGGNSWLYNNNSTVGGRVGCGACSGVNGFSWSTFNYGFSAY